MEAIDRIMDVDLWCCAKCGDTFKHPYYDEKAEDYKSPCCCSCDFDEAVKCEICGEYFSEDKLHGGACDDCITEKTTDYDFLFEVESEDIRSVMLPNILIEVLGENEIVTVLQQYVKENKINCSEYINKYKDYMGERINELNGT